MSVIMSPDRVLNKLVLKNEEIIQQFQNKKYQKKKWKKKKSQVFSSKLN